MKKLARHADFWYIIRQMAAKGKILNIGLATFVATLGVCMTSAAGESLPSWAKDADPAVYAAWVEKHGPSTMQGEGAKRSVAPGGAEEDYSAQFLMDVDAATDTSTIYLSIESINVSPQGSQITIKGMAGGKMIPLGKDHESFINGVLNVKVGNAPGEKSLVSMSTEGMVSYSDDGIARVTVPATAGNFIKATIDFKPAERKLSNR